MSKYLNLYKNLDCIIFNIADEMPFGIFPWLGRFQYIQKGYFDFIRQNKLYRWNIWGAMYSKNSLIETYDKLSVNEHLTFGEDMLVFVTNSYFINNVLIIPHVLYYYNRSNFSSITNTHTYNMYHQRTSSSKINCKLFRLFYS